MREVLVFHQSMLAQTDKVVKKYVAGNFFRSLKFFHQLILWERLYGTVALLSPYFVSQLIISSALLQLLFQQTCSCFLFLW